MIAELARQWPGLALAIVVLGLAVLVHVLPLVAHGVRLRWRSVGGSVRRQRNVLHFDQGFTSNGYTMPEYDRRRRLDRAARASWQSRRVH